MRHILGGDRAQSLLLPASVEDYVGEDNPVRVIEAFVDGFDLAKTGFVRAQAKDTGRPGYHPGDLRKLYLYGCLNRVRSSRRLEAECHRNLEVSWLLRGLRPDFKTLADFRRENALAFKAAFRHFVVRRHLRARARASRRAHDAKGGCYARVCTLIARREQNFVAAALLT